mmetsp:Transcript_70712/g.218354  ORF Transcript_70712/g.218354 Transcript_70712/m.218354 type:complete len:733 (-) Transcript_70712:87-2285(-)
MYLLQLGAVRLVRWRRRVPWRSGRSTWSARALFLGGLQDLLEAHLLCHLARELGLLAPLLVLPALELHVLQLGHLAVDLVLVVLVLPLAAVLRANALHLILLPQGLVLQLRTLFTGRLVRGSRECFHPLLLCLCALGFVLAPEHLVVRNIARQPCEEILVRPLLLHSPLLLLLGLHLMRPTLDLQALEPMLSAQELVDRVLERLCPRILGVLALLLAASGSGLIVPHQGFASQELLEHLLRIAAPLCLLRLSALLGLLGLRLNARGHKHLLAELHERVLPLGHPRVLGVGSRLLRTGQSPYCPCKACLVVLGLPQPLQLVVLAGELGEQEPGLSGVGGVADPLEQLDCLQALLVPELRVLLELQLAPQGVLGRPRDDDQVILHRPLPERLSLRANILGETTIVVFLGSHDEVGAAASVDFLRLCRSARLVALPRGLVLAEGHLAPLLLFKGRLDRRVVALELVHPSGLLPILTPGLLPPASLVLLRRLLFPDLLDHAEEPAAALVLALRPPLLLMGPALGLGSPRPDLETAAPPQSLSSIPAKSTVPCGLGLGHLRSQGLLPLTAALCASHASLRPGFLRRPCLRLPHQGSRLFQARLCVLFALGLRSDPLLFVPLDLALCHFPAMFTPPDDYLSRRAAVQAPDSILRPHVAQIIFQGALRIVGAVARLHVAHLIFQDALSIVGAVARLFAKCPADLLRKWRLHFHKAVGINSCCACELRSAVHHIGTQDEE